VAGGGSSGWGEWGRISVKSLRQVPCCSVSQLESRDCSRHLRLTAAPPTAAACAGAAGARAGAGAAGAGGTTRFEPLRTAKSVSSSESSSLDILYDRYTSQPGLNMSGPFLQDDSRAGGCDRSFGIVHQSTSFVSGVIAPKRIPGRRSPSGANPNRGVPGPRLVTTKELCP
jgi:hypothetical protein